MAKERRGKPADSAPPGEEAPREHGPISEWEDVFSALDRLAAGDPSVRLDETRGPELGRRLRRGINLTASNLEELVDFSHDLAIGLAENFDVLQRVGQGDLSARIQGESRVELVEFLRDLTNHTVGRLAGEIESHRADREELLRLATAVEQSAEGMVITDAEGVIRYVNPAFVQMTGYPRSLAVGRRLRELETPESSQPLYEQMMRTLRGGRVWRGRMKNRRSDGRLYEEDCTASPVVDASGTITEYVIIKRDVSLEEEMKRRLAHSQKLEALGTMAGGIAHELNNLLTPIVGFAELSLEEEGISPLLRRNLGQVLAAAERSREIILQILAFSRAQEDDSPTPLDLPATLRESLELLRAAIPANIGLSLSLEVYRPVYVLAGATQIQQILMNLALNSASAMSEGVGNIRIVLREARPEKLTSQLRAEVDRFVEILVIDDGVGIEPELVERIFEPFYTTKPVGKGTGLGLAVVHGIVNELKGFVSVESRPGKGTTFHIVLPLREGAALAADVESQVSPGGGGGERILLVDDEAPVVEVFRRQLEFLGYEVVAHVAPEAALAAFLQSPQAFDLVVTDNAMPGITGLMLAREIHGQRPDLPVLLCTGFGGDLSPERLASSGVCDVLSKPVSRDGLGRAVRKVLDSRK